MIAIIDYGAGNLTSVRLAFESLGVPVDVTNQADRIRQASRIVFPGVGAARAAMESVQRLGFDTAIRAALERGIPFLGICLGAQIVLETSEENGGVNGMGLIPGSVKRFQPHDPGDKIPHMGWNSVRQIRPHPLLDGIADGTEFYFVHSYYPAPSNPNHRLGETEYAQIAFTAMIATDNLAATQFHPEKSGRVGLRLLRNFSQWNGEPC